MLARLIVHEAIDSVLIGGVPDADNVANVVADEVIDAVQSTTRSELEAPTPSEPLDKYVQTVIATAVQKIATSKRFRSVNTLLPAATAMQARAAQISCTACAGSAKPCDGANVNRDSEIVAKSGKCIEPFRDMFGVAMDIVRAYYTFALGQDLDWPQQTNFVTAFKPAGVDAHPYPSPAQISGAALRDGPEATIELLFCPARFTGAAYLAAGYVLVHEALHLMEGVERDGRREPARSDNPFVEGWIDWIAFRLFEDTSLGRGAAAVLGTRIATAPAQRERSSELHLSRFNTDKASAAWKPLAYRLLSGKRAAEHFHSVCRRRLPRAEAWRFFLTVSFLLNAKGLQMIDHMKLINRVLKHLPPPGPLQRPLDDAARSLLELIRAKDEQRVVLWLLE